MFARASSDWASGRVRSHERALRSDATRPSKRRRGRADATSGTRRTAEEGTEPPGRLERHGRGLTAHCGVCPVSHATDALASLSRAFRWCSSSWAWLMNVIEQPLQQMVLEILMGASHRVLARQGGSQGRTGIGATSRVLGYQSLFILPAQDHRAIVEGVIAPCVQCRATLHGPCSEAVGVVHSHG